MGLNAPEAKLGEYLLAHLQLPVTALRQLLIEHKSLDARHKNEIFFVYTLRFEIADEHCQTSGLVNGVPNLTVTGEQEQEQPQSAVPVSKAKLSRACRPVIVGAGPAGLFAGLKLALAGLKPLIIERGEGLPDRIDKVNRFWEQRALDPDSNIQFGIGGAGTFSDGKLMTRVKDPHLPEILQQLVAAGGPPEILYWQYPHIGTDLLREVVTNLQSLIIDYGGEFRFHSCLTDLVLDQGNLHNLTVNREIVISTALMVLAIGNGARDTYEMLLQKGLSLEAKPFAVGLRIEHPQDLINTAQYGKWAGHPALGPAEYRLTFNHQPTGRGVYSFCMCPGGMVVGATSELERVVTNGMSYHARSSGIANSAIIVTVGPKDFGDGGPLAGVRFQRALESKAFQMGGSNYSAPVQRVADFLQDKASVAMGELKPTYLPGYTPANLRELLPREISEAIADGIRHFANRINNFDWPDAVLTGVETRTSAPVRILRGESRQAIGGNGIYPVGEGAGYAGGIISSALDGWKTAEEIIEKLSY
ncbi:MAG TPA: hypothetical protein DDW65_10170 [Firmicutes bacterium]|nr:hypothetical protein [Bacillota bacterium]